MKTSTVAMYSTSVVDRVTYFYNLDYYNSAPPAKLIIYSEVDFLKLTLLAISVSASNLVPSSKYKLKEL